MAFALRISGVAMAIVVSATGCAARAERNPSAEATYNTPTNYSQRTLLKNWALSVCLAQVSKNASDRADANATASAYLEFGQQPIEAYDALRVLAKRYADRKYGGSIKSELNTMKCIDLFHSRALDDLTRKLAP